MLICQKGICLWESVELERFLSRDVANSSQNHLNDKFQNNVKEKKILFQFQPFQINYKLVIEDWKREINKSKPKRNILTPNCSLEVV